MELTTAVPKVVRLKELSYCLGSAGAVIGVSCLWLVSLVGVVFRE